MMLSIFFRYVSIVCLPVLSPLRLKYLASLGSSVLMADMYPLSVKFINQLVKRKVTIRSHLESSQIVTLFAYIEVGSLALAISLNGNPSIPSDYNGVIIVPYAPYLAIIIYYFAAFLAHLATC